MSLFEDGKLLLWLFRAVQILLALGGIILVHEFGHYIAAKWSKMQVDEFAVGVGPTLKSWERKGTLYRICPFLFMGYVRIRGLEGEPEANQLEGSFYTRPHHQRLFVITAGAIANVVFASVLFCLLFGAWGVPDVVVDITEIVPGSAAQKAGLEPGWRLVSIDDTPITDSSDVSRLVSGAKGRAIPITVARGDERRTVTVKPRLDKTTGRYIVGLGFREDFGYTQTVQRVEPASPARRAGIKPGDRILRVNGKTATHPTDVMEALSTVPEELELADIKTVKLPPVALTLDRDGEAVEVSLTPRPKKALRQEPVPEGQTADPDEQRPVQSYLVAEPGLILERRFKHLPVGAALAYGFRESLSIVMSVVDSVGILARGALSGGKGFDQIGGPVKIVQSLSEAAYYGLYDLLRWAANLSIMIGVFNLLPLPALDGGRVVFILIDWAFWLRRREVNRRFESWVHAVGLVMLLLLMVFFSVRDIHRW
jgi:regulator of sigma E protease